VAKFILIDTSHGAKTDGSISLLRVAKLPRYFGKTGWKSGGRPNNSYK
jgi:hypothetical protein